ALVPMIGAAQMRTLRAEGCDVVAAAFDIAFDVTLYNPGGAFFADHLPAIHAVVAEGHFHRRVERQAGHIANLDPLVGFLRFRREKKVGQRGQSQSRGNKGPNSVNRAYIETSAGGFLAHLNSGLTRFLRTLHIVHPIRQLAWSCGSFVWDLQKDSPPVPVPRPCTQALYPGPVPRPC